MRKITPLRLIPVLLFLIMWTGNTFLVGEAPPGKAKGVKENIGLKSITFNHDEKCTDCDAINLKKYSSIAVRIPEWFMDREPQPAAYIKDKYVTIKAVFSAGRDVETAQIRAKSKEGYWGDLNKKLICLKENGDSCTVYFDLPKKTPGEIKAFDQVWEWYAGDINGSGSPEEFIGCSKNKIYVIFREPQFPWTVNREMAPWEGVLDYSCKWAEGESQEVGIATKISEYLYHNIGAFYEKSPQYTNNLYNSSPFELKAFLGLTSSFGVGGVNCNDMSKALVLVANSVGCRLSYTSIEFNQGIEAAYFQCIQPVGLAPYIIEKSGQGIVLLNNGKPSNYCYEYFGNHSFAVLENNNEQFVFDPTFAVASASNNCKESLNNIPFDCYLKKIKRVIPNDPKSILSTGLIISEGEFQNPSIRNFVYQNDIGLKFDINTFFGATTPGIEFYTYYRFLTSDDRKYIPIIHNVWTKNKIPILDITLAICENEAEARHICNYKLFFLEYPESGTEMIDSIINISKRIGKKVIEEILNQSSKTCFHKNIAYNISVVNGSELPICIENINKKILDLINKSNKFKFKLKLCTTNNTIEEEKKLPLYLNVETNGAGGKIHCFWRTTGGGKIVAKRAGFFYTCGVPGKQSIELIAINEIGLIDTDTIYVNVIKK